MTLYIEDKFDLCVTVHADAVFWSFTNMLRLSVVATKYTYDQTTDMEALYRLTPKAFAVKLASSLLEFIGVDLA